MRIPTVNPRAITSAHLDIKRAQPSVCNSPPGQAVARPRITTFNGDAAGIPPSRRLVCTYTAIADGSNRDASEYRKASGAWSTSRITRHCQPLVRRRTAKHHVRCTSNRSGRDRRSSSRRDGARSVRSHHALRRAPWAEVYQFRRGRGLPLVVHDQRHADRARAFPLGPHHGINRRRRST